MSTTPAARVRRDATITITDAIGELTVSGVAVDFSIVPLESPPDAWIASKGAIVCHRGPPARYADGGSRRLRRSYEKFRPGHFERSMARWRGRICGRRMLWYRNPWQKRTLFHSLGNRLPQIGWDLPVGSHLWTQDRIHHEIARILETP